MDDPAPDAAPGCGVEHRARSLDVDRAHQRAVTPRVAVDRGEMKDGVTAIDCASQRGGIEHVTGDELALRWKQTVDRARPVEGDHVGALREQRAHHMGADEATSARDERPHQAGVRRRGRSERAVPRAMRRPKRVIALGIRSAWATTSASAAARPRTSSSLISSDGRALITFIRWPATWQKIWCS